ncbi:MAG: Tripartite-type tricarboxylate transporter, receptor component TctC [Klenkia sp.]|nr:Tripartite-type tricarboxylate transporter, receptor component TctC [Klenkia sp.]
MSTRNNTRRRTTTRLGAVVTAALLMSACGSGGGSDPEALFEGEDIDLVVPYEPGGGYDAYARALAPALEECLGATLVVRNEPGAGGLVASNRTAAAGPRDNRIQIVNTVGLVSAQIAEAEGAQFDLNDLNWLGRISSPPNVLVVAQDSPVESFQDLVDSADPVQFVAQGPGANDYIGPNILAQAYEFPYEIITGFAGAPEARTAVIAGNADAHVLPIDSQLAAIEAGDVRPLVTVAEEPDPLLPDTPTIYETEPPTDEARTIIDNLIALGETGRGLMASPQMEEDRVTALREGFQCAVEDADTVAELEDQQRPLDALSGADTAALVAEVLDGPEGFRELVVDSY